MKNEQLTTMSVDAANEQQRPIERQQYGLTNDSGRSLRYGAWCAGATLPPGSARTSRVASPR